MSSSSSSSSSDDTDTTTSNSDSHVFTFSVIVVLVVCLLFSLSVIAGLSTIHIVKIGHFSFRPAASCAGLSPSSPAGYYWVKDSKNSSVRVYCDMTMSCGGGGWMRVAELNMKNSNHKCPSSLEERRDPPHLRTCVRNEASAGCSSVELSTNNVRYSTVCGRIVAYQVGRPNQFDSEGDDPRDPDINAEYLDGLSLTYGDMRKHIWSFAASVSEDQTCICDNDEGTSPPKFIGQDYFCEAGVVRDEDSMEGKLLSGDPLWDGTGCKHGNTCCTFNNPPWFHKRLPQPTADDIELRACRDKEVDNEDLAIEIVEIYTQ